ncbi:MAG TPA: alanine--glyoxylate aminotransferase family protein [Candidatus Omnitrophica bacterium]|nr:alanine--glyoxylate aminotransferase family protein [Candidatus Omnitrophota bacterium]
MKKSYLLTPGPTPLPPEVLDALSRPIIHHRTDVFRKIIAEAIENLKYILQTKNDVFILASSGTGAMEASVVNVLSSADYALTIEGGKFGQRWTEICKAYGINCDVLEVEWGKAVEPEVIQERLRKNPKIKAVFVTHCETSTGVVNDIEGIAEVVAKTDAVLIVDAISSLGAMPIKTDKWGIDIVVAGSQKGLMLPPGLAFVSVSKKALKMAQEAMSPNYYFSFKKAKKAFDSSDTPFTPAIPLVIALNEALNLLRSDGLDNLFAKYKKMACATRAAVFALGLKLLSPDAASDAVTAIKLPQNIDGAKLVKVMRTEHGVWVAGGQAELKGKIIRIAHMGYIKESDILIAISSLEKVLDSMGYKFQVGAGLKAAEDIFSK